MIHSTKGNVKQLLLQGQTHRAVTMISKQNALETPLRNRTSEALGCVSFHGHPVLSLHQQLPDLLYQLVNLNYILK